MPMPMYSKIFKLSIDTPITEARQRWFDYFTGCVTNSSPKISSFYKEDRSIHSYSKKSGSWLAPYMYPSYPPPIPLWAIGKPRRKFVPYFGKSYTTTTTTKTTTTARPTVLESSCSHLPAKCWNTPSYLPLPLDCIGNTIKHVIYNQLLHFS